jgi:hypothetical protein
LLIPVVMEAESHSPCPRPESPPPPYPPFARGGNELLAPSLSEGAKETPPHRRLSIERSKNTRLAAAVAVQ